MAETAGGFSPGECLIKLRVAKPYDGLLRDLKAGGRSIAADGVAGPLRGLLAAALSRDLARPVVVVAGDPEGAREICADASFFLNPGEALLLPDRDLAPYEPSPVSPQITAARLKALSALPLLEAGVVVTTVAALHEALPPPARLKSFEVAVARGAALARDGFLLRLVEAGYRRVEVAELPGDFAARGAVVDIISPGLPAPLRVELDGDTVADLREFDPATQRSLGAVDRAVVGPAAEAVLTGAERGTLLARLPDPLLLKGGQRVARLRERLEGGGTLEGEERYLPWVLAPAARLSEYFPDNAVLLLVEPSLLRDGSDRLFARAEAVFGDLSRVREPVPKPGELLAPPAEAWKALENRPQVRATQFPMAEAASRYAFSTRPLRYGPGEFDAFVRNLRGWTEDGTETLVACAAPEEAEALVSRFRSLPPGAPFRPPRLADGTLSAGVELPEARLVLLPARDVLGAVPHRAGRRAVPKAYREAFADLKTGEPVVHEEYGIGIFQGVVCLSIDGVRQDFFLIEYANHEKIYLPVDQVHRVQKYLGTAKPASLSHLGTKAWERTKAKVRENLRKFAEGLLKLYAERQVAAARPFPPLPEGEEEFAATFPYEETEDQERVIAEVGAALAEPRPMDRLVCGDVGYGKTEVALRAAFRVAMRGAQTAILVPTTILAEQHYQNFRARLTGLPVRIEMLSRFRSAKDRKAVAAGLADGTVDIVVGTHHLLSKAVKFRRLGLLVIDEEHRFGVKQKERLKELRRNVHVLTLTATPIPRTLNMGLSGLRDLSVIETPPPGRLSVVTHVLEESPQVAREAILREMARGGQVFYLHNRVQSIGMCARKLAELVPEARLTVGHGQMAERELERTMERFMARRADVLVCTSIIGAGLDLPNANTLIVERAENFGLADLYQLRGRVGRSVRQAYSYFFFSPRGAPTLDARRRLAAMLEFGELGSGFRLALRDLEIRGAGNLLGPQQHGVMQAVGFDLYARLLESSVRELKGEVVVRDVPAEVSLGILAFLPDAWVPDGRTKLEIYKRLAACEAVAEVDALVAELRDRLGEPPAEAGLLFGAARVRALATPLGIASVKRAAGQVVLTFRRREDLEAAVKKRRLPGRRTGDRTLTLASPRAPAELVGELVRTLGGLAGRTA